jgi:DNA-binding transcriptional LysR family regulator
MNSARDVLTPDTLAMVDSIARNGSFAAAARELGVVPSALTYRVRLLEDALDVLLFDRSSRQAQLTEAGRELLREGQRLLIEIDAIASRIKRVATGWEAQLTIAVDDIINQVTMLELCEAFFSLDPSGLVTKHGQAVGAPSASTQIGPPTRLRLRKEVLSGTWEALITGQADLAIGAESQSQASASIQTMPLGDVAFIFCVAPGHPLASAQEPLREEDIQQHRAIAVADTAVRFTPASYGLLPGQRVLTVSTLEQKLHAQLLAIGCGYLPEPLARPCLEQGRLIEKSTRNGKRIVRLVCGWRTSKHPPGHALAWWLRQLASPVTRQALLERKGFQALAFLT